MVWNICTVLVSFTGISRLCVPSFRGDSDCPLKSFQTNVLVDRDGRAHITGLATAFIPSMLDGDVDRSFPGTAPELIDQSWSGGFAGTGATTASDVYAFGILAWEVRANSVASLMSH